MSALDVASRLALISLSSVSTVAAHAQPSATTQVEISYLLATVASSGCAFYRNGSWYDAKQAESHLNYKYQILIKRKSIGSAEDFIEAVGTRSSLSGVAYAVRCPGANDMAASEWLRQQLALFRRSQDQANTPLR